MPQKHVYSVPVDGTGAPDDPFTPAHEDEHEADPANYNRHYRGNRVYIASRVKIGTYEDYAADDDSDVERVPKEDAGEFDAPEPPESDEESD